MTLLKSLLLSIACITALLCNTTLHAQARPGIPLGMSGYPSDKWCGGKMSAAISTMPPSSVGGYLRAAQKCRMRVGITFQRDPMKLSNGRYSPTGAKALVDAYVKAFPADSFLKYYRNGTLLFLRVADDVRCVACWGGHLVLQSEVAPVMIYAKQRIPGVPLEIRVAPDWVAYYHGWHNAVDLAASQYLATNGDPVAYFAHATAVSKSIGINLAMGVSVSDYPRINSAIRANPAQTIAAFRAALDNPYNCAADGWRYDGGTWPYLQNAMEWAAGYAATKTPHTCLRS